MYRYILISLSAFLLLAASPTLAKAVDKSVETDLFPTAMDAKKAAQTLVGEVEKGKYFHPPINRFCRGKKTSTVTKIQINESMVPKGNSLDSQYSATVFFRGKC